MELHTDDMGTSFNRDFYDKMIGNFKQVQTEDAHDHETFNQEVQNRKDADKGLQAQINKVNDRLDKLDAEKATHDDVEELRKEMYQIRDSWHDRASHIARGTDIETTKAVVEQILQEKGLM